VLRVAAPVSGASLQNPRSPTHLSSFIISMKKFIKHCRFLWLLVASVVSASAASIQTDKLDYAPTETVFITGSGWLPGETVLLEVDHVGEGTFGFGHEPWTVTADPSGKVSSTWYVHPDDSLGATFLLTAIGVTSGQQASATFTDAAAHTVAFAVTGLPAGTSVGVAYSGTNNGGNPVAGTVTFLSPGPSNNTGFNENSVLTVTFPTVPGFTLVSPAPGSNFTLGAAQGSTTITGIYQPACTAPVFANCTTGTTTLGCNPTPPACDPNVTASNNLGPVAVTCTPGAIVSNGINRSQSFVYSATSCGLTTTCTKTYTWTVVSAPVFANCTTGTTPLGCNPAILPTCDTNVTASNEAGSVAVLCAPGSVQQNGINRSQSFVYTATACGLTTTCTKTYTWTVVTAPVFANCTTGTTPLGCNPATLPTCDATITASNEAGAVSVVCTPGSVQENGINRSQAFVYTATACGLTTTCTKTYTWTVVTAPVFANCTTGTTSLGCNPATLPTCDATITASNEAGAVSVVCTPGSVQANGINRSQAFVYSATACGLTTTCTKTYTWTVVTAPVFANCTTGTTALGCNPTPPTCDANITASNEAGPVSVVCTPGAVQVNGCNRSQSFVYTATSCGLTSTCTKTYTWTVVTAPVFANCTTGTTDLGCNPTAPTCDVNVTASNECGAVPVICTPGTIQVNGCNRTQSFVYTATACGLTTSCTKTFTWIVDTTAPTLSLTAANAGVFALGTSANVTATFGESCSSVKSVVFEWDDGSPNTTVNSPAGSSHTASHAYAQVGVYIVKVTVTDGCNNSTTEEFRYVVIYDPTAGFVTGGGWINSPAGAYPANLTLAGKANFGFNAKYKKGQTVPTGETEFQFQVGNVNFKSTDYQWLVVSGAKAQYKGNGTLNGQAGYWFMLTATDGQVNGDGGVDKFRIKIINTNTGATEYDNVPTATGDDIEVANPQAIAGGSIVIHAK
jgi:hypothetical protein